MSGFWLAVGALVPSIGVGLLFWFAIRSIVQADRRERMAVARLDAEERRAAQDRATPEGAATQRAAEDLPVQEAASRRPAPRVD